MSGKGRKKGKSPEKTPAKATRHSQEPMHSGQNGDEIMTPVEISELQESAKKLKEDLTKQQQENKVRENLIEKLKDNNRKLEQDITGYKETVAAMEKQGKIEMKKLSMEIEFSTAKLQKAHSEITKLKETIEENEKKFLEKTVIKDGEEEMTNETAIQSQKNFYKN
ncbi:unnamed protein product [Mytilus edulis]|uniref:Uncharacterized protein n=1 Tax=Mytilus edulis TaxID=6550 RepID=A0A8S3UUA6_MYTED|nr:unnamed protein product [Mytilus edulis]